MAELTERMEFRLTEVERASLRKTAERIGCSEAAVLRMAIGLAERVVAGTLYVRYATRPTFRKIKWRLR